MNLVYISIISFLSLIFNSICCLLLAPIIFLIIAIILSIVFKQNIVKYISNIVSILLFDEDSDWEDKTSESPTGSVEKSLEVIFRVA